MYIKSTETKRRVTMKDLRVNQRFIGKYKQGQTIYQAALEVNDDHEWVAVLVTYFLYSHKEPLTKGHELVVKMNESYVNWQDEAWGDKLKPKITTSRRKAEKKLKELQKEIINGEYGWL